MYRCAYKGSGLCSVADWIWGLLTRGALFKEDVSFGHDVTDSRGEHYILIDWRLQSQGVRAQVNRRERKTGFFKDTWQVANLPVSLRRDCKGSGGEKRTSRPPYRSSTEASI